MSSREKKHVLHILPRVPPAICGIGDYSWRLAQSLWQHRCIESSFLCAGIAATQPEGSLEFPVSCLSRLTSKSLLECLTPRLSMFDAVILHLSSYGFQKRGVPFWLANAWKKLARIRQRPALLSMFHELAASGPITSSAFWLQPLQKWVIHSIARASDGLRTNRQGYADELHAVTGKEMEGIVVMPVFSNFGEPQSIPRWEAREPAMVMFGWGIFNGDNLAQTIDRAVPYCKKLGLNSLHIIGGAEHQSNVPGVEIKAHGYMREDQLSSLLLSCRAAYSAYNPECFAKSTLMAAFASHGLVVVCQGTRAQLADGLFDGVHLLNESSLGQWLNRGNNDFDKISAALKQWYDEHSLLRNADSYAKQLARLTPRLG